MGDVPSKELRPTKCRVALCRVIALLQFLLLTRFSTWPSLAYIKQLIVFNEMSTERQCTSWERVAGATTTIYVQGREKQGMSRRQL